ncbi:hypothetical protein PC9H_007301 [Pleurotus ostreatus]|uniref:Muskelin N-terminal domain-containing protein n=1 Tax=Pleurotus ostreatus TaxID=5322 RepID=A0A8H6ZXW5_PLEOS|nr:uncharacterized protein PC9H_007301 [Pleurotus ostreatus]KAF7428082.1 hypothetical protein PC9H_007301 [Pleurotus ostreatus]KAJ8696141.1 hypothetical protein PTI98_006029 [Pleurotus ostreatus]
MSSSIANPPSPPAVPLTYSVAACSEHSGKYEAHNIMTDRPTDQTSRWSSVSCASQSDLSQWILLRLDALSIVKSITFGKFHKAHPCNMKEFQLYVGMTEDHLTKVLEGSLKNDTLPETFPIEHANTDGVCFPVRFVKIVPLSAHGQNFHTSIWYVSLSGILTEATVEQVRIRYDEYRETTVLRHILKYLRQRRLLTPFQHIIDSSRLQLEHPLVTKLHQALVLQGDWEEAETVLARLSEEGLFESYIQSCHPYAEWIKIDGVNADGDKPSARGGHAMCMDSDNGVIYLFGGWDGEKSLDDFWAYDVAQNRWKVLSTSTSADKNGPGPRSCHKMVFDSKTGYIYLLGRLNEFDLPAQAEGDRVSPTGTSTACSEFHRYHTRGLMVGKWDLLSFDTTTIGGPPLVTDHQMVIDSDAQIIYVFGGRVMDKHSEVVKYSGFYSYNIRLSKWRTIPANATDHGSEANQLIIPPRYGHSMLLDSVNHTLLIFGGQHETKHLSDMYAYDTAKSTTTELFSNFSKSGGPDPFFTQRAVIDPQLGELYVFPGLQRTQGLDPQTMMVEAASNWLYRIDHPRPGKWSKILSHSSQVLGGSTEASPETPSPRYAHQIVYDTKTKTVYLHGGNGGIASDSGTSLERSTADDAARDESSVGTSERRNDRAEGRLDDFWKMVLKRPEPSEIVRRATYVVRQQQFREMCELEPSVKALHFLQNNISGVVNHSDPEEAEVFRSLLTHLLSPSIPPSFPVSTSTAQPSAAIIYDGDDEGSPSIELSRSTTPEGTWTDCLVEDDLEDSKMEETPTEVIRSITAEIMQAVEDPMEKSIRGEEEELSGPKFRQRTEVFEVLLSYIDPQAKQPDGYLPDMMVGHDKGM